MPRKAAARSASRGRAGAKSPASPKSAKKSPARRGRQPAAAKPAEKMEFEEGDKVMAKWPGTSLFFRAKVTYVRDDDNEYDVQYEDGTIFTIKAKEVRKATMGDASTKKATPSRSRSRGRSPGRKAKASPARTPKAKESPARVSRSTRKSAVKAPKPEHTPTRSSARLASAKVELSSDEDDGRKAIPNPDHPKRGKKSWFANLNLQWLSVSVIMIMGPLVFVALQTLCKGGSCKLQVPKISRNWRDYWDLNSFLAFWAFGMSVKILGYLPIGSRVRTGTGNEVRLNGLYCLLAYLGLMPLLVYRKADLSFVTKNYWNLAAASMIWCIMQSLSVYIIARWGRRSNANPKGNTGNFVVDFYYGREFNPYFLGSDIKLLSFRVAMIGLAVGNCLLVLDSLNGKFVNINWAVVLPAAFQILYSLDAMFFEEYFFFSHDAMNNGYGFNLSFCYLTFPFIPTLVTR